jgi:hypothetical protein
MMITGRRSSKVKGTRTGRARERYKQAPRNDKRLTASALDGATEPIEHDSLGAITKALDHSTRSKVNMNVTRKSKEPNKKSVTQNQNKSEFAFFCGNENICSMVRIQENERKATASPVEFEMSD